MLKLSRLRRSRLRQLVRLVAVAVAGGSMLVACSSAQPSTDASSVGPTVPAAVPAVAPPTSVTPAGMVWPLPGNATAVVVDTTSRTLAVAIDKPASVLLFSLDDMAAPARSVSLPGAAAHLSLAAPGGPLLVPVPSVNAVVRVALPDGANSAVSVPGGPTSAAMVGDELLVALPSRQAIAVVDGDQVRRTITGAVMPDQVLGVGTRAVALDKEQSALFDVDPASGSLGAGLRAGDGATNAVVDSYGRVLTVDTRTGELLLFSANPLLMRQRYPVDGVPFGIAFDPHRDLAWVTLTASNLVIGYDVAGGEPVEKYRLPTIRQPDSVAVDPDSGRVFVLSATGGGIQVIRP